MLYDAFVMGMRSLLHINTVSFLFYCFFFYLYTSDEGLANGPKLVTQLCVNHVVKDCIINIYN